MATERYLLEEMTEAESEAFEEHYFNCAECAAEVVAGATFIIGVRAITREGDSH